jgi:hypothetical protein
MILPKSADDMVTHEMEVRPLKIFFQNDPERVGKRLERLFRVLEENARVVQTQYSGNLHGSSRRLRADSFRAKSIFYLDKFVHERAR